ncbi:MAG: retroviral-like aspartic protease family protein [Chloroflexi bacterium]|nr:retroviral-like aspartic protease family protein [Chloroflexota bacterium]
MKFPYNSHYFPAAPGVEVRLGAPDESLSLGPLPAFVDTGADITVIPKRYVKRLQPFTDDYRYLRSQWGERRRVAVCSLEIGIGALHLPSVEVVADERGDETILGRNVLNKLVVTLNGPKRVVEILE